MIDYLRSTHPASLPPRNVRALNGLGISPPTLPKTANLSEAAEQGAFVHILGCVERDVNSQLTRVLGVDDGVPSQPKLKVLLRDTFQVNQR